jgi:hypothetical protein
MSVMWRMTWFSSRMRCPGRAPGRRAVLRDRRADARPAVVSDRRARRAAPVRARGRRSAQVRAASAEACACCRARTRRRAAAGHPTTARAFVRLHNQRVSAGDRRRRDYRHDPRAASADDARQRRPRTLRRGPSEDRVGGGPRGSSPAGALGRCSSSRMRQRPRPRACGRCCPDAAAPSRLL